MRLVPRGFQIYRSLPRRQQDVLSLRTAPMLAPRTCRECWKEIPFVQARRRSQATLCPTCIDERIESLAADAL